MNPRVQHKIADMVSTANVSDPLIERRHRTPFKAYDRRPRASSALTTRTSSPICITTSCFTSCSCEAWLGTAGPSLNSRCWGDRRDRAAYVDPLRIVHRGRRQAYSATPTHESRRPEGESLTKFCIAPSTAKYTPTIQWSSRCSTETWTRTDYECQRVGRMDESVTADSIMQPRSVSIPPRQYIPRCLTTQTGRACSYTAIATAKGPVTSSLKSMASLTSAASLTMPCDTAYITFIDGEEWWVCRNGGTRIGAYVAQKSPAHKMLQRDHITTFADRSSLSEPATSTKSSGWRLDTTITSSMEPTTTNTLRTQSRSVGVTIQTIYQPAHRPYIAYLAREKAVLKDREAMSVANSTTKVPVGDLAWDTQILDPSMRGAFVSTEDPVASYSAHSMTDRHTASTNASRHLLDALSIQQAFGFPTSASTSSDLNPNRSENAKNGLGPHDTIDNATALPTNIISWPESRTFAGNYLTILLTIILKLLWTPVLVNVRMMEPFILMTRPQGAPASRVLFSGYLTSTLSPAKILKHGSSLPLAAVLNTAIIALIVPLSSEAVFLDTDWNCRDRDLSSSNPCWPPRISVDPPVIRTLQALLGMSAMVVIFTIGSIMLLNKPSLCKDSSSIAGIIDVTHHPVLLQDLRAQNLYRSDSPWKLSIPDQRLCLHEYVAEDGRIKTGVVPLSCKDHVLTNTSEDELFSIRGIHTKPFKAPPSQKRSRAVLIHLSAAGFCLSLLGLIIAYYNDMSDSGFNRFFNSNTFGPRFILTSIATILSFGFESLHFGKYILMLLIVLCSLY